MLCALASQQARTKHEATEQPPHTQSTQPGMNHPNARARQGAGARRTGQVPQGRALPHMSRRAPLCTPSHILTITATPQCRAPLTYSKAYGTLAIRGKKPKQKCALRQSAASNGRLAACTRLRGIWHGCNRHTTRRKCALFATCMRHLRMA